MVKKHLDDRLEPEKKESDTKLGMDCVEWVSHELHHASGALYVRRFLGNDSKNAALEMVENIRDAFRTMLGQNTWMDLVTKKRALSKLDNVILQIGFPDFYLHDSKLDAYYKGLEFDDNDSYASMLGKIAEFNVAKEYQKLLAPTDRRELVDYPFYVPIASYERPINVISFTTAFLHYPPRFDKSFPKAMNYGGLGMLVGHEFTHGYDDNGAKNDGQGSERDWWERETMANFQKQKQCLIDQYSAFRVPELNMTINGTQTAAENLADNVGIKLAYKAYQAYLKNLGHEEERLPGFEHFTNEQLFFINNGISWCMKQERQSLKQSVKNDVHAPARYRVNGPLANLPEFAAAFNCPKGSPMNPEKKCQIW